MEKTKSKSKSPSIYRFIPAFVKASAGRPDRKKIFSLYSKALRFFTLFIFVAAIIVLGFDLYRNIKDKEKIDFEREEITKELIFWQSFVAKHQDYKDAYLQLAILEYRLRDINKAKFYLGKALIIDPNSEKGRELEKILNH